jgi:Pyridoxal-dependent decarboxylase, pyridoxal binding domain
VRQVWAAALTAGSAGPGPARPAGEVPGDAVCLRAAGRGKARVQAAGWWRAWWARFGLAEVCGTLAAVAGFAAGYLVAGSLLAAAGLATLCEAVGFYGCVGAKTAAAASRATAHLAGWRRLAAGTWHAMTRQLASCAVAEALDGFVIRPGCLAGAAWLARPLPGGVWLGFAVGKAAADLAWYGMEASARRGVARSLAAAQPVTPYLQLDITRATDSFRELAAALPRVIVHYAVKANPHPRLLACLHAAGCRFEAASWAEVRAVIRAGADPSTVLFTNPVKPAADIARAWQAGVWRFAADSDTELDKIARNAPGSAVLLRIDTGAGSTVGDQGKFGIPPAQAPGLARLARSLGLTPYGLAFHVGSQTMDPRAWDGPIRQAAQIMTALAADRIRLAMARRHAAGQPGHRRVPRPDRSAGIRPRTALPGHHPRRREPDAGPLHADRAQLRQPGHHPGPGVAAHAARRRPGADRQRRRVHHLLLRPQQLQRLPSPGYQDHEDRSVTNVRKISHHQSPNPVPASSRKGVVQRLGVPNTPITRFI